jgi:hypothetical protein
MPAHEHAEAGTAAPPTLLVDLQQHAVEAHGVVEGDHAPVDRSQSRVLTKRTLQASLPTAKERDMSQASREQMPLARSTGVSRRHVLAGTAAALATASMPVVWPRAASAAGKLVLRTIGGAYEEAVVKAIVEPFTKATGIEVVKVPATLGKLLAMFESGNIEHWPPAWWTRRTCRGCSRMPSASARRATAPSKRPARDRLLRTHTFVPSNSFRCRSS